jgi:hypothetical protein
MNCIAPHEDSELELVEVELKPLAILYHDKNPKMYRAACVSSYIKHRVLVRAGVIAIATSASSITAYQELLQNRKNMSRVTYQRYMGNLLGYNNNEINEFINSDISKTCTCVECGGALNGEVNT